MDKIKGKLNSTKRSSKRKNMARDMTKGRILPQMTAFAIPLILGNLFQILYNATDSIIVGKFVGDDALAAVGTAGPIMNMAILLSAECAWARAYL